MLKQRRICQEKDCEELKVARKELTKQRGKYRGRRRTEEMLKVKREQTGCQAPRCDQKGETTIDRQKWKEELERYSRCKYRGVEMRKKARKDLEECEERSGRHRSRKHRSEGAERREPKLTKSVIMQSRASFQMGKQKKLVAFPLRFSNPFTGELCRKS